MRLERRGSFSGGSHFFSLEKKVNRLKKILVPLEGGFVLCRHVVFSPHGAVKSLSGPAPQTFRLFPLNSLGSIILPKSIRIWASFLIFVFITEVFRGKGGEKQEDYERTKVPELWQRF